MVQVSAMIVFAWRKTSIWKFNCVIPTIETQRIDFAPPSSPTVRPLRDSRVPNHLGWSQRSWPVHIVLI